MYKSNALTKADISRLYGEGKMNWDQYHTLLSAFYS